MTPYTVLVQDTTARYIFFLTIMLVKGFVVIVAFPCTTILLTNSATSLRILGTLNGVATTFSGLGRAAGPAAAGAVFSWGVQRGYVIAAWWFLGLIALMGTIPPWFIIEGDGPTASSTATSTSTSDGEEESLLQRNDDDDSSVDGYDEVAVLEALEGEESESETEPGKERKKRTTNGSYGTMNNGTAS